MLIGIGGIFCVCYIRLVCILWQEEGLRWPVLAWTQWFLFSLSSLPSSDRVLVPLGWRWRALSWRSRYNRLIPVVLLRRPVTAPVRAIVYYCRCVTRGYRRF